MEIERLREYIVLAHRLNFTLAAKDLHLSQPTLSNHIKVLESEVECTLIERIPGDITRLTLEGQEFLTMAQTMIRTYDETIDKIKSMRHSITGQIRIRNPRNEYSRPFLEYAYEFKREHPDINIIFSPWVAEDGYEDVLSGKADCSYVGQGSVIDGLSLEYPTLNLLAYDVMEGFIWVDKNSPLATKDLLTIKDLDGQCILIPANQKNESWKISLQTMANENGIEISFNEKYCDSMEDLIMNKIEKKDLFIGFEPLKEMPVFDMRADRIIRSFNPSLMFRMSIVYADDVDNPALTAFVQFLREKYAASKAD